MAAIDWLRLWHDMPNDPKWRTIARVSGQPISLVLSVYLHLMVDASRNVTRGHVTVTHEDIASALDVTEDAVQAVFEAMQGRVMDGDSLSGWEKRQPKREDQGDPETGAKSAAQRKREQREREKLSQLSHEEKECHDESRIVTESHAREEKRREEVNPIVGDADDLPTGFVRFWETWPSSPRKVAKAQCAKKWRTAKLDRSADQIIAHVVAMKGTKQWQDGYEPAPMTYLNQQRWFDGLEGGVAQGNPTFAGVE